MRAGPKQLDPRASLGTHKPARFHDARRSRGDDFGDLLLDGCHAGLLDWHAGRDISSARAAPVASDCEDKQH
jgi:hypothetical protein